MLVGLKPDGIPLNSAKPNLEEAKRLVRELLGLNDADRETLFDSKKGIGLKLTRLPELFKEKLGPQSSKDEVNQCVRAFLLYTLGRVLFLDKSGGRVSAVYMYDLEDVGNISKKTFGAGCLAHTYHRLGHASRHLCRQLSGYMPLIELWTYAHIPTLIPSTITVRRSWSDSTLPLEPLIKKWDIVNNPVQAEKTIVQCLRRQLDSLRPDQIIWIPYGANHKVVDIGKFRGVLTCHDVREVHLPDRVVQQLGLELIIPDIPIIPLAPRQNLLVNKKSYSANFIPLADYEKEWSQNLWSHSSSNVVGQDLYMKWYKKHSHVVVGRATEYDPAERRRLSGIILSAQNRLEEAAEMFKEAIATMEGLGGKMKDGLKILKGRLTPSCHSTNVTEE